MESCELTNLLNQTLDINSNALPEVGPEPQLDSKGKTEVAWFSKRIKRLKLRPMLCLNYDRIAFLQMDNLGPIRLTVDRDLGCCTLEQSQFPEKLAYQKILEGKCVIEMKYRESVPTVFREIIEEFKLVSQPVSKFRNAIVVAGLATDDPPSEGAS